MKGPCGGTLRDVFPGQPAEIAGLRGLPQAGDELMVGCGYHLWEMCLLSLLDCWLKGPLRVSHKVVHSEDRARRMSEARGVRAEAIRQSGLAGRMRLRQTSLGEDNEGRELLSEVPVVIKADTQGSAETVRDALLHLANDKVMRWD
jgi:translation initiation factor IF-2